MAKEEQYQRVANKKDLTEGDDVELILSQSSTSEFFGGLVIVLCSRSSISRLIISQHPNAGDYFAASPDPSSGSMIWVAGEYHSRETWSTYDGY